MTRIVLALAALVGLAAPAQAQEWMSPPPTSQMDRAAERVRTYLASVPNMPKDILVIPAAGDVLWPGASPGENIRAEIWVVVPKTDPEAKPLMMFAVRPSTGEVFAMFLHNVQKNPRYK